MIGNAVFGVGARVKVIKQRKYPGEKLIGLIGVVRTDSGSNVSVIFDGMRNTRSSYGAYYFKPVDLVEVDENDNAVEENTMNKITNYLNTAKVRFVDDSYNATGIFSFANFDGGLKEGDLCAVCTDKGQFRLARVVGIDESNTEEMYREVIAKVHTDEFDARVRWREEAAELISKMEARAKQLQDVALYKMLAENDSEMAVLLNAYQALPKI